MIETGYRFLYPVWDSEELRWIIMAAQPLGNVYIEGGFMSMDSARQHIEQMKYLNPNPPKQAANKG